MNISRVVLVGMAAMACAAPAAAQTQNSYPMLMSVRPVAAQIGQTSEHEVSARYNLFGASQVLFATDGAIGQVVAPEIKPGEKPPAEKPNQPRSKIRVTAADNAVPGVRDFRLATPHGATTLGQLILTREPVVSETGDNNTREQAQAISIPAAVCGTIEKAEDVDCYKFQVAAGAAWTFHVYAQRLEDRIHDLQTHVDPIITLRNAAGSTLATSDNYYFADPLLHHKFEHAGEYTLEIRDVRYQGNADWVYCIEISTRPFVTQVLPLAAAAGTEIQAAAVGLNLPAEPVARLTIPAGTPPGVYEAAATVGGTPANAVAVYVTPLPVVAETPTPADAPPQTLAVPGVVCGRIAAPGEVDRYTFAAKQGEKFSIVVAARRARSALDSNLRVLNASGGALAEVDDMRLHRLNHADSWLENWAAPADGNYTLEIRDLHLRGGPEFVYALEITRSQPYFELEADTDKTELAPGIAAPLYVRVNRKNGFAGDVQLAVAGLPAGVSAIAGRILATSVDGCILLEAQPNAAPVIGNIQITGTATHPVEGGSPLALAAAAHPLQEVYSPGGGRAHYPVEMHTVSVAEPMDIRAVRVSATEITLKPGESKRIEVTIERAPGFKQNVTLDVLYQHLEQPYGNSLPKGVKLDGGRSKTLLSGEESQGFMTLVAAADAPPVEKQLVPVMAHVSVNFVMKMTWCQPLFITVTPP